MTVSQNTIMTGERIDVVEDNPEKFNIFSLRSFGESFYHHITDSALEDGYIGI